jgi:hypothetical protein
MATLTIDLPEAPRPQAAYRLAADCPHCRAPLVLHQNHQAPGSRNASVFEAPVRRRSWWHHRDGCTRSAWSPWEACPTPGCL